MKILEMYSMAHLVSNGEPLTFCKISESDILFVPWEYYCGSCSEQGLEEEETRDRKPVGQLLQ